MRGESDGRGQGATFTITLPLVDSPTQGPRPDSDGGGETHKSVLIVEDNKDAADSLREVLELGGHDVELVYSGVTRDSIRLHYREYTQQDMARPAFSQDVTYERDATTIRFRNILIKVIQASGEQIRFVVLEDGYPPHR